MARETSNKAGDLFGGTRGPGGTAVDTGEGENGDVAGPAVAEDGGGGTDGGTGCEDVVYEKDAQATDGIRVAQNKGTGHIGPALRGAEACLGFGVARPAEGVVDRYAKSVGEGPGEEFGLVEASPESAAPMERDGDDEVKALVEGEGTKEEVAEGLGEGCDAGVFEEMDEIFEDAFVVAVGVGRVIAGEARAATAADAVVIERAVIEEGGAALGAEVVSRHGRGLGEATEADRDATGVSYGLRANLTVLGEDQIEQGREGPLGYGRKERFARIGYRPTGEDPPPKT